MSRLFEMCFKKKKYLYIYYFDGIEFDMIFIMYRMYVNSLMVKLNICIFRFIIYKVIFM